MGEKNELISNIDIFESRLKVWEQHSKKKNDFLLDVIKSYGLLSSMSVLSSQFKNQICKHSKESKCKKELKASVVPYLGILKRDDFSIENRIRVVGELDLSKVFNNLVGISENSDAIQILSGPQFPVDSDRVYWFSPSRIVARPFDKLLRAVTSTDQFLGSFSIFSTDRSIILTDENFNEFDANKSVEARVELSVNTLQHPDLLSERLPSEIVLNPLSSFQAHFSQKSNFIKTGDRFWCSSDYLTKNGATLVNDGQDYFDSIQFYLSGDLFLHTAFSTTEGKKTLRDHPEIMSD